MRKLSLLSSLIISSFVKASIAAPADSAKDGLWPSQLYETESFTAPRVSSYKHGKTAPGLLFLTLNGDDSNTTSPLIMTEDGELVWRPQTDFYAGNFGVQQLDGKPVLSYWRGTIVHGVGIGYGEISILDSTYNTIHTLCASDLDITPLHGAPSYNGCKLDFHESKITAKGTMLVTVRSVVSGVDLIPYNGPKNGYVLDSLAYEFDIATGKVLFRWSAWEHREALPPTLSHYPIDPTHIAGAGNSTADPWDFFHMNSIDDVEDGYLISSRFYWCGFLINKQGEVQWVLNGGDGGDFTLPEDAGFRFQHDIRAIEQSTKDNTMTISMYDNNNDEESNPTKPSSGLELLLDLTKRSVKLIRRLQDPKDLGATTHTGGFQALSEPGHALMDYGMPPVIKEYDATGRVAYSAQFGTRDGGDIYRAYKYNWDASPTTTPKLVARNSPKRTETWVSWNGATSVVTWIIHAGESRDALEKVNQIQRKGLFETHLPLNKKYAFVQAEAVDADGKTISKSPVIAV